MAGLAGRADQGAAGPVSARPAPTQGWLGRGRDKNIPQGLLIYQGPASHAHPAQTPRQLPGDSSQQLLAQNVWL